MPTYLKFIWLEVALEGSSRATNLVLKFYTLQNFTLLIVLVLVQIKQLRYLNKEEVGLNLAPTYKLDLRKRIKHQNSSRITNWKIYGLEK